MSITRMLILLFPLFCNTLSAYGYDNLPPEKRLQICTQLRNELNPTTNKTPAPRWWRTCKFAIAGITGAGAAYALSRLDNYDEIEAYQKSAEAKLDRVKRAIHHINGATDTTTSQLKPIASQKAGISQGQLFMFTATGAITYFLLTLCIDRRKSSHLATLKNFLARWPDYSVLAPEKFQASARSLYAAYLHQGDDAVADEKTAELVIMALTFFLAEEIDAISQSLS